MKEFVFPLSKYFCYIYVNFVGPSTFFISLFLFSLLQIMEVVLRQGLVHPVTSVPTLVALEVDFSESNSKLAHKMVVFLYEKYV